MADVFDETKIPALDLNVETISSNASTLKTKAGDMRSAGSTIKTTWSGMSACYKAPEQETLYAAMNPVETNTDDLADDLEKIAGYVSTFADTAKGIKSDAQTLKKDGQAFKAKIAKKPDWQYDQELVNENTRLVNRASALQVRLWDAERECANNIRALDSLPPYHADPKSEGDKLGYGYSSIPAEAEKPWGKSVERKDHCPKKAAVSVKRFVWDGVVVDGIGGTLNGLAGLGGFDFSGNGPIWSGERLGQTWKGLGGFIGLHEDENGDYGWHNPGDAFGTVGNTLLEAGKGIICYDEWGKDPARAAGGTAFNVLTFLIPPAAAASKAGKFGAAGSKLSKVGRAAEVANVFLNVTDPFGALLSKPLGKVSNAVVSRVLPNFDLIESIGKWTGADPDVKVGAGSGSGFDMNNPDTSGLKIDGNGRTPSVDVGESSIPDISSGSHHAGEGVSTGSSGRPDLGSGDAAHADTGQAAETSSHSESRSGTSDASRTGTDEPVPAADSDARASEGGDNASGGAEGQQTDVGHGSDRSHSEPVGSEHEVNDVGQEPAGRDGDAATDKEHARQAADAEAGHADVDGHREPAQDGADRAGSDAEPGRDRTNDDATEGRERTHDSDGHRADSEDADRDRAGRDAEVGRNRTDGDAAHGREHARDGGRVDADGRREPVKNDADGADRDRAERGADAEPGRDRTDRDAAEGHERVRDADGHRADADGTERDRAAHGDGSDAGRDKTDSDAVQGRNRAHQGDGDGSHADADGHSEPGKNDADAANSAEHDAAGRDGDSDAESGDGKSDGDGSGEDPDKKPLTVEERQEWVDQLHEGRDQDAFNQKHRTVGPDAEVKVIEPGDKLYPKRTKPFGVGVDLEANAHYEVTRTTKSGVNYKTHYYTDASGEVRHVETNSRTVTGELNPDLRQPYPNATYTVDGKFHYTTDGWARTVRLEVDGLYEVKPEYRGRSEAVQSRVNKYAKDLAAENGKNYEGGHMAGDRFGGPPEEINTVAMLEEVNQYRVDSDMESFKLFEEEVVGSPGDFNKLVLEFDYPDPADPAKLANSEKVPTRFEATWVDANGKSMRRRFENVPAGGGQ